MRRATEHSASTCWFGPVFGLLLGFGLLLPSALPAQDEPFSHDERAAEVPDAGVGTDAASSETRDAKPPDETERKRQKAIVGMLVLALVCFVFLVLILVVILWARRIRNLVRKRLPDQHPGDPLWYLRSRSKTHAADDEE